MQSPIFSYMEADYLDIGSPTEPQVEFMRYFTRHDESPQAVTVEKQYVADKNMSVLTTGWQTQFPIVLDEYQSDAVCAFIRDIAEEQQLGVSCSYFKVRLHQPVEGETNTFYARKFTVNFAIDTITREGGAIKSIEGAMNAIGDVVIGVFNTETRTFTAN